MSQPGGNLISDKGLGAADTSSANIASAGAAHAKTKRVLLFAGGHKFKRAGRGKIRLKLTKQGRAVLARYHKQVKAARRHDRHVKPLRIAFTTIVGPVKPGDGVAVYGTRVITITP